MSAAREFLFATWEGGGNIAPVLTLVRLLRARGHGVRLLGDACTGPEAREAGAEFIGWQRAPSRPDKTPASDPIRDWDGGDPSRMLSRLVERLMCGPALAHARDVLAELRRRPADAIVTSEMLFGPMLAGEAAGVPVAALGCNLPIIPLPGVPPFGAGLAPARDAAERARHAAIAGAARAQFESGLPALNEARAALGLAPLGSVGEQLMRLDRFLAATAQAFNFPAERLPPHFRYVGPLLDEPVWAGAWANPWADSRRPLVLVAFSTTFQNQAAVLGRVIEALGGLQAEAVVTTGPSIDAGVLAGPLAAAPNVALVVGASHDDLMRRAAVVVTHCGHGTVMRALRARVPMLCMPMGRDQRDNAVRVTERGAGLQVDAAADPAEIRTALVRLLDEPSFAAAAAALGRAVAAETAPERAADAVEEVAGMAKRPARPPGDGAAVATGLD